MAEQNRKTTEQKLWRIKAQETVDDFLDYMFSDRDQEGITKESRSLLGIYSEHGHIPRGSGFSGFCKLAGKVDRMRFRHVTDQMRRARDKVSQLDEDLLGALCIDRCYRGRTKVAIDPFTEERIEIVWDDERCASLMSVSSDTMRKRISRGYKALEIVLQSNKLAA